MSGKVSKWLGELGLGQYAVTFEENDIDWDLLGEIDQGTLKDIGIASAGHRLQILKGIKTLNPEQIVSSSAGVEVSLSESISDSKKDADISAWPRPESAYTVLTQI